MKSPQTSFMRGIHVVLALAILAASVIPFSTANANQITTRSLTLEAGATDGGSKPGGVVNHLYTFTLPSVGNASIGSIKFEYCTTAANSPASPACVGPTGLNASTATLSYENNATGFVNLTHGSTSGVDPDDNNVLYISRASASAVNAGTIASYRLSGVTNPTNANETFFVRISTYASLDTSGSPIDSGTVTAATAEPIILSGTMPESLVFCTGESVPLTATVPQVPDCANATDGTIDFNQLFSPTDTSVAFSQMAASTNAGAGYAITVNGATMTSGSNTITGMTGGGAGSSDLSVKGTSQFGLNLRANTAAAAATFGSVTTDQDVAPAANAVNYRGEPVGGYATADYFKFVSGNTVASSTNGGAGGTDAQIFTASYVVNVPGSQPAGTYTTTLTYICTPTF